MQRLRKSSKTPPSRTATKAPSASKRSKKSIISTYLNKTNQRPLSSRARPSAATNKSQNYHIFNPDVLPAAIASTSSAGTVLYISHLLPDPNGTAAGVRTMGVLRSLQKLGFQPIMLTPNKLHTLPKSQIEVYNKAGIPITRCEVNDPTNEFEEFVEQLSNGTYLSSQLSLSQPDEASHPSPATDSAKLLPAHHQQSQKTHVTAPLSLVIFDRYTVEEIFGIRLRSAIPPTNPPVLSVIDTQDLHFLRYAREDAQRVNPRASIDYRDTLFSLNPHNIMRSLKASDPNLQRELATYFRSDFILTVSQNEANLLHLLGLPQSKTLFIPITHDIPSSPVHEPTSPQPPQPTRPLATDGDNIDMVEIFNRPVTKRENIVFIGTMRHHPNVDCVSTLRDTYVPLIGSLNATLNSSASGQTTNPIDPNLNSSSNSTPQNPATPLDPSQPLQSHLSNLRNELSVLQLQQRPSIHVYGTHMTKEQSALTLPPDASDIALELKSSQTQHTINQLAKDLFEARSNPDLAPASTKASTSTFPSQTLNSNFLQSKGPFVMRGTAKHAIQTVSRYKVLFSPLNFGAGVKGKVIDAFLAGTPVVGTQVTAEGFGIDYSNLNSIPTPAPSACCQSELKSKRCQDIMGILQDQCDTFNQQAGPEDAPKPKTSLQSLLRTQWPGAVHIDSNILASASFLLSTCDCEWQAQHDKIAPLISQFSDQAALPALKSKLIEFGFSPKPTSAANSEECDPLALVPDMARLSTIRDGDFVGQLLYNKYNNSQYYMGKYINMKNQHDALAAGKH